ncbi:MAG TPA: hypothetical protein VF819_10620 [Nitrospira sp.]
METKYKDSYYAEFDENSGLYCVFGSESGKAFASYVDKGEATAKANQMNMELEHKCLATENS